CGSVHTTEVRAVLRFASCTGLKPGALRTDPVAPAAPPQLRVAGASRGPHAPGPSDPGAFLRLLHQPGRLGDLVLVPQYERQIVSGDGDLVGGGEHAGVGHLAGLGPRLLGQLVPPGELPGQGERLGGSPSLQPALRCGPQTVGRVINGTGEGRRINHAVSVRGAAGLWPTGDPSGTLTSRTGFHPLRPEAP